MAFAIQFDVESLTIGEIEDIEAASGINIMALGAGDGVTTKFLSAFAWVVRRRNEPALTLIQVRDMKLGEITSLLGAETLDDPTEPGAVDGSPTSGLSAISTD